MKIDDKHSHKLCMVLDSSGSVWDPIDGYCEYGNETSGSIKAV
jgi:hypothetical protein